MDKIIKMLEKTLKIEKAKEIQLQNNLVKELQMNAIEVESGFNSAGCLNSISCIVTEKCRQSGVVAGMEYLLDELKKALKDIQK